MLSGCVCDGVCCEKIFQGRTLSRQRRAGLATNHGTGGPRQGAIKSF